MTIPRIAAYGLGIILAVLVSLWGFGAWQERHGSEAEHNAAVAAGEAQTHEAQARATEPEVADLKALALRQAEDLARVSKERDVLLAKWKARPIPVQSPANDAPDDRPQLLEQLALAEAVIEKDGEEIAKQEALIKSQSELILVATKRGDEWEAACHARERQAKAQEEATKAWKSAVTSSRWRGRIEGFAAGVALGYVGGKR